jgi:hypothetical protein
MTALSVVLGMMRTAFASSFPCFLTPRIPSSAAVRAAILAMSAVDDTTVGSVGATRLLDETGVVLVLIDGDGDILDAFMRVLAVGTRFIDVWVLFVVFDAVWTRRGDVVGVLTCSVGARNGMSSLWYSAYLLYFLLFHALLLHLSSPRCTLHLYLLL